VIDIGDTTEGIEELVEVMELAFEMKLKRTSLKIGSVLSV